LRRAGVLLLALALCGCGGASSSISSSRTHRAAARSVAVARPVNLVYRPLFSLPAAVQDPAFAALPAGRFALLGGITPAVTSTPAIVVASDRGPMASASLPGAQHDAQAATIDGQVYVFGGGEFTQYDHILRFDPGTSSVTQVGSLPSAQSDVAVAAIGGTAYVVGGFDGNQALDTIVSWRPGGHSSVAAHLPVALRYASVVAVGGDLLIIGGSTPTGASDAIYRFDPANGRVARVGRLPRPTTHAGAAVLGAEVYLVGGRGETVDARRADVLAINPSTGKVRLAGQLPSPLSDAGVLTVGDAVIVAGGHTTGGTEAAVGELVRAR
jgi:N-acetylneuraminic acid mutarotase